EADHLEARLKFLHALAGLWRTAARPDLWPRGDPAGTETLGGWLARAEALGAGLTEFLFRLHQVPVPEPLGGHEGMIEFDRRRALKGHLLDLAVATCVETRRAAFALSAALGQGGELPPAGSAGAPQSAAAPAAWMPLFVRLERATARRDVGQVRKLLPGFVALFR